MKYPRPYANPLNANPFLLPFLPASLRPLSIGQGIVASSFPNQYTIGFFAMMPYNNIIMEGGIHLEKVIKTALDTYVNFISSLDGVIQIYLFGSLAYGAPHERSDIDLMVVIDDKLDVFKMMNEISTGLIGKRVIPLDVLVNRKSVFRDAAERLTIQNHIKSEGVLLYEK